MNLWLFSVLTASLVHDQGTWRLPTNSLGERCEFPLDPLVVKGAPLGMYHCPSCGDMVVAGMPHPDWSTLGDDMRIDDFKLDDYYGFLSNFWRKDGHDVFGYPSMEHYFQAMKTHDKSWREQFKRPWMSCGEAKRLGRQLRLRSDWEQIKIEVMLTGLRVKFAPGTELAQMLLETGASELVEGNTWHDNTWGDCRCGRPGCEAPGENHLGALLQQVRGELRLELADTTT